LVLRLDPVSLLSPQAVSGGTTFSISQLNQAALSGKNLNRQLSAVFPRHSPFRAFD
jgi:hypothetical protein